MADVAAVSVEPIEFIDLGAQRRRIGSRMDEAINQHDLHGFMASCTEDVVCETSTPPDGERFEGQSAMRGRVSRPRRSSRWVSMPRFGSAIRGTTKLGEKDMCAGSISSASARGRSPRRSPT